MSSMPSNSNKNYRSMTSNSNLNFGMLSSALLQFSPKLKTQNLKPQTSTSKSHVQENKSETPSKPRSLFDIKLKPLGPLFQFASTPQKSEQNESMLIEDDDHHEDQYPQENHLEIRQFQGQNVVDTKKRTLEHDMPQNDTKRVKYSGIEPNSYSNVIMNSDNNIPSSTEFMIDDESDDDCNVDEIQEFFVQHTGKLASTLEELATEMEECKDNLDELSVKLLMINNEILLLNNPVIHSERTENIENLIQRIYEE